MFKTKVNPSIPVMEAKMSPNSKEDVVKEESKHFGILINIFFCLGLLGFNTKKPLLSTIAFFTSFLVHLIFTYVIFATLKRFSEEWFEWKINMGYLTVHFLSLLTWHLIRYNRHDILSLLKTMRTKSNISYKLKINAAIASYILLFLMYSFFKSWLIYSGKEVYDVEFNAHDDLITLDKQAVVIYSSIMQILVVAFPMVYIFLMHFLFLINCHYIKVLLGQFNTAVQNSAKTGSFWYAQENLLKRYLVIIDTTQQVQRLYSKPSFCSFLGFLVTMFSTIASFALLPSRLIDINYVLENVFLSLCSLLNLFLLFYFAGQIPIKMVDVKMEFSKVKAMSRSHIQNEETNSAISLIELIHLPEFVISGCGVVQYRLGNIFTTIGGLVTYAILLIGLKDL